MVRNSITVTFGYTNTDSTRKLKFTVDDATALDSVKAKALAINASLSAGSDDGLADFFRADDFDDSDANNIIGRFNGIVALQSDSYEETVINLYDVTASDISADVFESAVFDSTASADYDSTGAAAFVDYTYSDSMPADYSADGNISQSDFVSYVY